MNTPKQSNGSEDIIRRYAAPAVPDIPPQGEDECGLPDLKAGAIGCCARPSNKPCFSIHFLKPDGSVRSFQYRDLDSNTSYEAGAITLKFLGMEPVKVVIRGRNLWSLYDYIHAHRMPWIMEASREMGQDAKGPDGKPLPVVSAIRFEAVSEEGHSRQTG